MAEVVRTIRIEVKGNQLATARKDVDLLTKELRDLRKATKNGTVATNEQRRRMAELSVNLKAARNNYRDLEASTLKANNALRKNSGFVKGVQKGFAQAALKIGLVVGAFRAVTRIIGGSLEAYDKQRKAEKSLQVALGKTSQKLLDQASALQAVTRFGDEATIQGQAFLAQMGATEEQILKITPAILDFAEAQGMNVNDAFKLVSKTLGSSTNALSRYGIEVTGAVGSADRLDNALNSLTKAFDGQAQAAALVGTGSFKQLGNTLGDLSETIGGLIANGLAPLARGVGAVANGLINMLDTSEKTTAEFVAQEQETNKLIATYEDLAGKTELNEGESLELQKTVKALSDQYGFAVTEVNKYGVAIAINTDIIRQQLEWEKEKLRFQNKERLKELEDIINSEKTISLASKNRLELAQKTLKNELFQYENFYKNKSKQQKEDKELDIKIAKEAVASSVENFKESSTKLRLALEEQAKLSGDFLDKEVERQKQAQEDALKAQEEARAKAAAKRLAKEIEANEKLRIEQGVFDAKQKTASRELTDFILSEKQRQADGTIQLQMDTEQEILDGIDAEAQACVDAANDKTKADQERFKNIQAIGQETIGVLNNFAGLEKAILDRKLKDESLSEAKKEELLKKSARRQKAIAISQTVIEGSLELARINANPAVNADISQTLRTILSVAAIARTAFGVATIAAQPFADGGVVGSGNIATQPNGDNVAATLKTGEVVLNSHQQALLGGQSTFKRIGVPGFANGGQVGGASIPASVESAGINQAQRNIKVIQVQSEFEEAQADFEVANTQGDF